MFRMSSVAAIALGLVLLGAGTAGAQHLSGGCRAVVGGRSLPSLTFARPLPIKQGEPVSVNASVPSSDPKARTRLTVNAGPFKSNNSFKGTSYNRTLNPPDVLFNVVNGVIKGSGTASGRGFSCSGSGYFEIEGNSLVAVLGGAILGAGGAAGVAAGSGPKAPPSESVPPKAKKKFPEEFVELLKDVGKEAQQYPPETRKEFVLIMTLLIVWFLICFLLLGKIAV